MEVTGKPRWPRVIRGYGYNHCGFPAGMDSEQPFDRGYGFNSEIRGYFQPKNYLTHGKVHSSWFKQSIAASDLYRLWHTVLNLALQLYKYSLWTRRSIYDKQRWSLVNRTYRNYLILKVNDCLAKTLMGKALSGNSLHEWRLMMHQSVLWNVLDAQHFSNGTLEMERAVRRHMSIIVQASYHRRKFLILHSNVR